MKPLAVLIATGTLILNVGVAGAHAGQSLNLTISGTAAPSTVDLGTGTEASEYNLASNGGSFAFRAVTANAAAPQASASCSGAHKIYFSTVAGMGVLRTPDGSLLQLTLTKGSDCIDLDAGNAFCIRAYQVVGGTGRFQNAAAAGGAVTLTMTVAPVVPGNLAMFVVTGEITGTVGD